MTYAFLKSNLKTYLPLGAVFLFSAYMEAMSASRLLFSARMDGAQDVPPITTTAMGVGGLHLNESMDSATIQITASGLSGPIIGIHIHSGEAGVNGPVVVNLTPNLSGNSVTVIWTGFGKETVAALLKSEYYLNAHTASHPDGEIRGQLHLEREQGFSADLRGEQEVPAVVTPANGLGVFALSHDDSILDVKVMVQGFTDSITGAHLHKGPIGINGPIVVGLTDSISGNGIFARFRVSSISEADAFLDSLKKGSIYVNVHTTAHPSGEIRGQLLMDPPLLFDAHLTAHQEVPHINTAAHGLGVFRLNAGMDSLSYDIVVDGLTDTAISAHFHEGAPGVSGPVVIGITNSISGNRIQGTVTGAGLTTIFIDKMLQGNIYVNVHTAAHPSGEVRGQVRKLAREGFVFPLTGSQEVPPVTTTATGTGLVSLGRDSTDIHFIMAVDSLSSAFQAAHFHKEAMGKNGPVVFPLTPFFSGNVASGHWTARDSTPLTPALVRNFLTDSIYANVHTQTYPAGEIRGQVVRAPETSAVGIRKRARAAETSFSLVARGDRLHLRMHVPSSENVTFSLADFTGRSRLESILSGMQRSGGGTYALDIGGLKPGLYFLTMRSKGGNKSTLKFLKE